MSITSLRILVAEDETELRELYREAFEARGHRVFCASNGKEALAWLRDNKIDALITDIRMPEMNGADLIMALKQSGQQVPIVICVSAYSDLSLAEAYRMGVDAFFSKPVGSDEICAALEHFNHEKQRRIMAEDRLRQTLTTLNEGAAKQQISDWLRELAAALEEPISTAWGSTAVLRQEIERSTLKKHSGLRGLAQKVDDAVGDLSRVVASIKLLASEGEGSQAPHLKSVLDQALLLVRPALLRQNIAVRFSTTPEIPALNCGSAPLLQGLMQLLFFACEQLDNTGKSWLDFSWESMPTSVLLRIRCSHPRGKLAALGALRQQLLKAKIEFDICRSTEQLEFDILIPAAAQKKAA